MSLDLDAICAAHERIRPYVKRTPTLTSSRLDEASGASLFFKCENFQKDGAFKARGATNAVFSLDEAIARRGVATHSSGNHGTALARAAKLRGIPAHIVMPLNSAKVKVRAVESYGAKIIFCEPIDASREAACADLINKTGATLIHSFENENVMAGQGTAVLELLEDVDVDLVMCPVGGGGLLSGNAVAAKSIRPQIKVVAAEPANAGLSGSLNNGHVNSLPADFAVGVLALFASQFDQGSIGHRFYKSVAQDTQRYPLGADILTVGYVLLNFCGGKRAVRTNRAIIHQSAAGNDLCSMGDWDVRVMKKMIVRLMAYAQLRDLAGSA